MISHRGETMAYAARDLDFHINALRRWVNDHGADAGRAFPGHGQMRTEQLEIERLRREDEKLKAERDILKGSGRYRGFAWLSVSRAAAFTPGWAARPGCVTASSPAIAHMVSGGSGMMCWPKASHAAFIVSNT